VTSSIALERKAAAEHMPITSGTHLGPYEIVGALGAGAMGEVYKARDTRLDRTVAIKVLPSELGEDPDLRQRMEREARAISSLDHPHICALYDPGPFPPCPSGFRGDGVVAHAGQRRVVNRARGRGC
jgi:serine/threonine protein kinase